MEGKQAFCTSTFGPARAGMQGVPTHHMRRYARYVTRRVARNLQYAVPNSSADHFGSTGSIAESGAANSQGAWRRRCGGVSRMHKAEDEDVGDARQLIFAPC